MSKTTDRTKLFVRFLRERGIKYIYAEETLRYERIKKYEWKMYRKLLDCGTNGNLLNYFDKFFSRGLYNVISGSFVWNSTKNGYDFWAKIEREWVKNKYKQIYIND